MSKLIFFKCACGNFFTGGSATACKCAICGRDAAVMSAVEPGKQDAVPTAGENGNGRIGTGTDSVFDALDKRKQEANPVDSSDNDAAGDQPTISV